jgi:two-component system LytT family sensor kinase
MLGDGLQNEVVMTEPWKSWKAWTLIIGLGVVFGLIDASQTLLVLGSLGRSMSPGRLLLQDFIYWATYAALVPGVFYVASRVRLDVPFQWWRITVHSVVALLFVVVHLGVSVVLPPFSGFDAVLDRFLPLFQRFAAGNFLVYWLVVGIFYALYYHQQAREKEVQAAQLQAVVTESKLHALKSQLNPHFLFNTLNTIFVLAKKGDQPVLLRTIARLSDLLRVTTDESRPPEIPLSEELSFLELYLEIQATRFSDRLTVEYDIRPETRSALVPAMILQPLAENAIKYGLSMQVGRALIIVRSRRQNDALILEVADNGPGFGSRPGNHATTGIGLANTEARLRYLYGPQQSIRYSSPEEPGAVVTISVPFRRAPEPVLTARAG